MTKKEESKLSLEETACCDTSIHIANEATLNIYTCTPLGVSSPEPPEPESCPPELSFTGACVPWALGHKPKQPLETRLRSLLERSQVPAVLPAAFFRMARRFLIGHEAANTLDTTLKVDS